MHTPRRARAPSSSALSRRNERASERTNPHLEPSVASPPRALTTIAECPTTLGRRSPAGRRPSVAQRASSRVRRRSSYISRVLLFSRRVQNGIPSERIGRLSLFLSLSLFHSLTLLLCQSVSLGVYPSVRFFPFLFSSSRSSLASRSFTRISPLLNSSTRISSRESTRNERARRERKYFGLEIFILEACELSESGIFLPKEVTKFNPC